MHDFSILIDGPVASQAPVVFPDAEAADAALAEFAELERRATQ